MANNNKVLQTVVEIAGSTSPTLGNAVSKAVKMLGNVNVAAVAASAAGVAAVVGIAKAAVKATKELVNLGTEFDNVSDTIRIGTGATGEALDALMDDFDAVYGSIPTTMDNAATAIANYNTMLGLTGEDLQNISRQAIQVADLLGDDLEGVIESSSHAFQQWNIDAEDMGDAMDFVFKASQSTGVGFSKLMENVQTYGPQLRDMGYSFEEATTLIGQLEKQGVNTTEVLAAMKKGVTTLANEGIGAADGLQMYIDAIVNAKDETNATAIAAEIFGTRAASTMSSAIRDGTLDIEALTATLQENGETITQCAEDTYDFTERLQIFKQRAQIALEPLANTLFDTLNDLMPIVADLMDELLPVISEMTEMLTPLIEDVVTEIAPLLSELMKPLVQIAKSLLTKIIPPLVKIITAVLPVVIELVDAIALVLEPVFDLLGAVLPIIAELLSAVMSIVSKILAKVLPIVEQILSIVMPILTSIIEAVLPVLINLLETLSPVLDIVLSLLDPILDICMAILKPLLQLVTAILKPLISLIQTLIAKALKPLEPILQTVSDLFSGVLGAALSVVTPLIQMITDVLSGLIDFITNVFQGNWSGAWEAIAGIFSGIWNGIVGFFKGVINGLIGIVETGINAIISVINGVTGGLSKVWTWTGIPAIPEIPKVSLPRLATGGFTDGISIAGEEGPEAVISFDPAYHEENVQYWAQAGKILGVLDAVEMSDEARAEITAAIQTLDVSVSSEETPLSKASELLAMEGFSLGGLTETTVIYYDLSGLTWSPQIDVQNAEKLDAEDIVEKLKECGSEFLDWLEEWLALREGGRYDRVSVY